MIDLRKTRRSQVFRSHRLRHFFASDDHIRQKFYTICQHLDLVGCNHSDEQKLTVLLLIMVGGDMPQIADFIRCELANELMRHINNELNVLISAICHIVNEINGHDDNDNSSGSGSHTDDAAHYDQIAMRVQCIGARFENDNRTFRPNITSVAESLVELLSLLLQSFGHRCQNSKLAIVINTHLLHVFELCYKQRAPNNYVIEHNFNTAILAFTANGAGRLHRTKAIVEHKPLLQYLLSRIAGNFNNDPELLVSLQIISNLTNGFPENIEHLIQSNLLEHLRNYLVSVVDWNASHASIHKCLCILDNICGNHRSDIQAVINADLIAPIKYGKHKHFPWHFFFVVNLSKFRIFALQCSNQILAHTNWCSTYLLAFQHWATLNRSKSSLTLIYCSCCALNFTITRLPMTMTMSAKYVFCFFFIFKHCIQFNCFLFILDGA